MILVTGGTGFIGSHLVECLLAQGEPVRVLVRRTALFDKTPVQVFRGDLITANGLAQALDGVDTVVHLAGTTKALSITDYHAGNVHATENLARAIASMRRPVRMVHISSLAAVGPGPDCTPLTEDAEPHPVTRYGKSKLEGERIVRAILPDAVIVRPPAVYGPRDTDVFQVLKSINHGLLTQIAGSERYFSAIYVKDLVNGILAAARSPRAEGRTYFLAHPAVVSWSELVGMAARIMDRTVRVVKLPLSVAYAVGYISELWSRVTQKPGIVSRDKVGDMQCRYWICDTRRAKEELGFEAQTNIEEGLAITLAWYREAGWLKWE
jgi:nucleoside-diphosphate-sugar epimerase